MLKIGDALVSEELLEEDFVCNLNACKGECCVQGDSGAPLEDEETTILEDLLPALQDYLPPEGMEALAQQGAWVIDADGDKVTPLVNGGHCAYTIFENGIAGCGIEKAYKEGKVSFRKPISCHLYPVRITRTRYFEALNYHRWDVCAAACSLGRELSVPAYRFLKDALIRKYGEDWYRELDHAAGEILNKKDR